MTPRRALLLPLAAAIAPGLAACAAEGPFPSLAVRPAEREGLEGPPQPPPAEAPDDPALAARTAGLAAQARRGMADFEAAFGPARAAAAAAGPSGSDSWVTAQEALSRLEAARAETMRALGDLDQLALRQADAPTSAADFARIQAAVAEVEGLAAAQQSRLDALRRAIPRL